jgi:hypothetical protein
VSMCEGKVRYRDKIAAKIALASAQHQDGSGRPKIEKRIYRCPNCFGFHLTSQAKRRRGKAA